MTHAANFAPVTPIGAHPLLVFLAQCGLLLALALVLGRLAERLRMPALVGELCAGILLGPSVLQQVLPVVSDWLFPRDPAQFHLIDAVGQIGVLLLVGVTGTHLDLPAMRHQRSTVLTVSGFGLTIPLALGIALGYALPLSLLSDTADHVTFALFLGVAMCVSAIPVIAKIFFDMRIMHRDVAQMALCSSMIDDAFGWLMLAVVSAMATAGVSAETVLLSVFYVVAVVVFAATIGRLAVRWSFAWARDSQSDAATTATAAVLVLLSAAGTHALGLEAVLGAFICGILIGRTVDQHRMQPLRTVVLGVLAPVFFATAGLRIDLTALRHLDVLLVALGVLGVAVAGKFAGAYLGARLRRLSRWQALALGAALNARGVIEIIVAMVGLRLGVLNAAAYTIIVLVAVVTSLMAPPVLRVALSRIRHSEEEDARLRRLTGQAPARVPG